MFVPTRYLHPTSCGSVCWVRKGRVNPLLVWSMRAPLLGKMPETPLTNHGRDVYGSSQCRVASLLW